MASPTLGFVSSEPPTTTDQVPNVRFSRASNQELNYELQLKAIELEKLFAAHKLRVPGGDHQIHSNSLMRSRISKPDDHLLQVVDQFENHPIDRKSAEVTISPAELPDNYRESFGWCFSNSAGLDNDLYSMRKADYRECDFLINEEVGFFEESRGEFYERYKEKRDAKLKEEWSLNRDQKEAEMKAMHESLEHSRAEMQAKFSAKRDSALHARQRAERLRSFNIRSSSKNTFQQIVTVQNEDDQSENPPYQQERLSFTDFSTIKSFQTKKNLPNRSLSSAVHRTSATPITRSSVKASNSISARRRTKLSVSNPKASSGISKASSHQLFGTRFSNEDLFLVKEDKTRISQSLRNSSASSGELRDLPPRNSDFVVYTPLRHVKEQTAQGLYNKLPKTSETKPFLKKGSGIGPGAGAGLSKLKAAVTPDNLRNEEEFGDSADCLEGPIDMDIKEEELDFQTVQVDLEATALDLLSVVDNEQSRMSHESEKSIDPEPETGDALRSLSQLQPDLVAKVPAVPFTFHYAVELLHDSPAESPASLNSYMHHPLPFANETSDTGGFEHSSMANPALWNSQQSDTKMDTDGAPKRKKWGSSQKTILLANTASHHQPRKEVMKGLKRFLKFGRKSRRGTESPVDWISATTSEGDDEIEDGRMGFSEGHHSYVSFKNGELLKEQVEALCSSIPTPPENFKLREDHLLLSTLKAPPPKSFFSLSSFRNKGSESKLK